MEPSVRIKQEKPTLKLLVCGMQFQYENNSEINLAQRCDELGHVSTRRFCPPGRLQPPHLRACEDNRSRAPGYLQVAAGGDEASAASRPPRPRARASQRPRFSVGSACRGRRIAPSPSVVGAAAAARVAGPTGGRTRPPADARRRPGARAVWQSFVVAVFRCGDG